MKKTAIILLAAGLSRRLGQPKQLLQKDGKSLLRRTAEIILRAQVGDLFIVIGAQPDDMRRELKGVDYQEVVNGTFAEGMSSSIVAGARAARDYTGVLICLCDQIYLTDEVVKTVVLLGEKKGKIVRCRYRAGAGPPVYFPAVYFSELLLLEGDTGAAPVVKKHRDSVLEIPFSQGDTDIDRPADLYLLD